MDPVTPNPPTQKQWDDPPPQELGEVDLAGLRFNLRLTPDERLLRLHQHNQFIRELIRAREQHYMTKPSAK